MVHKFIRLTYHDLTSAYISRELYEFRGIISHCFLAMSEPHIGLSKGYIYEGAKIAVEFSL